MFYLPKKTRRYYEDLATAEGMNLGTFLLQKLINDAIKDGLDCKHPSNLQVLHTPAKTGATGRVPAIWRCRDCGILYSKKEG